MRAFEPFFFTINHDDLFSDPRVKDWFLMESYTPTLVITALYVMLVYAGKWWMEKREPYKLQMAVFYYNIGLVILNFYIFYQVNYGHQSETQ